MKRWTSLVAGLAILVAATLVRLPALTAGLPYMSYVDEGHVLHHVAYLLEHHTWEPDTYAYPTLPFYLVAGTALAWSPVYARVHSQPFLDDLSPAPPEYYDVLEPPDLIVIGRLVTLAFSLGVVLLTGLLVRRLAGPAAGLFAAWLAALVPALVMRSTIVNINPLVVFFVLAALFFAERVRTGDHPRRDAALAGMMAGFAGGTKYPAALVCLSVALAIVLAQSTWPEKIRRLLLAGVAAVAALLLAMPALALRTANVLHSLREMDTVYGLQEMGSYWDQAVHRAEWDLPVTHPEVGIVFLLLTVAGLVMALRDRRWRPAVLGWLLFAAATAMLVAPYKFRAFRNLLALIPLACALVALLYAWAREKLPRRMLTDLAAFLLPVILFAPALHEYGTVQLALVDSREQAIHWLRPRLQPNDRVLFMKELAFLPARIDTLPGKVQVRLWENARDRVIQHRDHYLVLGEVVRTDGRPRILGFLRGWILANYQVAAHFGSTGTPVVTGLFRGNAQTIYILKRVPRPDLAAARQAEEREGDPGGG
ncbi:MAG TPA: glycosyltransferase family 39 protein [Thermoanaerobaculia bacterium]|nr:glycosyltransferase family 39 protein [Thermoanaerobaculia bacterium]